MDNFVKMFNFFINVFISLIRFVASTFAAFEASYLFRDYIPLILKGIQPLLSFHDVPDPSE